jgi:hypothetical protein
MPKSSRHSPCRQPVNCQAPCRVCAPASTLDPDESQNRVRVMSTTTVACPRLPASSSTSRSRSALQMSISSGASTTGTPLISRGDL